MRTKMGVDWWTRGEQQLVTLMDTYQLKLETTLFKDFLSSVAINYFLIPRKSSMSANLNLQFCFTKFCVGGTIVCKGNQQYLYYIT